MENSSSGLSSTVAKTDPSEASFLKDVATHRMTVLRDDGVHRHVQFRRPESYCMGFDLVTWPGYLCYSGDMGTFVFSRLEDMFEFFRTDALFGPADRLHINLSYWSEKLRASDCNGRFASGAKTFSRDKFEACIKNYFDNHTENDEDWNEERLQALWDEIDQQILGALDESEHDAQIAVRDFRHDGFVFQDFFDYDCTEYTYHFVWCCYALAWGIRQYDSASTVRVADAVPVSVQTGPG